MGAAHSEPVAGGVRISVVVCTFNRSSLLRECLAGLAAQAGPATQSEVLVVDNNSADDTAEVAQSYCRRYPWFRSFGERQQGLAYARNRGWAEARGEYVAFIDDDARPCADWLRAIGRFADSHPQVEAFGGPYHAFTQTPMPEWFPRDYGCWDLGPEVRTLANSEYLNGTNMVFRRSLLQAMGGFDATLGMRGGELAYGEETELMMRMHRQGMPIYYVPAIQVEHAVLDYKMRLGWLLKSAYRNGRSGPRLHGGRGRDNVLRYSVSLAYGLVRALCALLSNRERHAKARIYRSLGPLMWQVGYFVGLVRRKRQRSA